MHITLTTSLSSSKFDVSRKKLCSFFQGCLTPFSQHLLTAAKTTKEKKGWSGADGEGKGRGRLGRKKGERR